MVEPYGKPQDEGLLETLGLEHGGVKRL